MKEINWSELKKKNLSEIKDGPCLKVVGDGEMVFYVVVNPQQIMKTRIEVCCQQIDGSRGF